MLRRASTAGGFGVAFDLVQVIGAPDLGGPSSSFTQGADYDHSQATTMTDLTAYLADWSTGKPSADFDNDGDVDAADAAAFQSRYQNP